MDYDQNQTACKSNMAPFNGAKGVPVTFCEWTTKNAQEINSDDVLRQEAALLEDIKDYSTYLREGAFNLDHLTLFRIDVHRIQRSDELNFDFTPTTSAQPSFRNWMRWVAYYNIKHFSRDDDYMCAATSHEKYQRALAMYADYLEGCDAEDDRTAFLYARNWLAENDRRELSNFDRWDHAYCPEGGWTSMMKDAGTLDIETSEAEEPSTEDADLPDDESSKINDISTKDSNKISGSSSDGSAELDPVLSFQEWVARYSPTPDQGPHQRSASLYRDVESYLNFLIGRPEYEAFECLARTIELERQTTYNFIPQRWAENTHFPSFQTFYSGLRQRHLWQIDTEDALTDYQQYLCQAGADQIILATLAEQRDIWARQERRLFYGMPRVHPEITHVEELMAGFMNLYEEAAGFNNELRDQVWARIDPAWRILSELSSMDEPHVSNEQVRVVQDAYNNATFQLNIAQGLHQEAQEELEEYRSQWLKVRALEQELEIHPERTELITFPEPQPKPKPEPEIVSVPREPWFHVLELKDILENAIKEVQEAEEKEQMSESDEDDPERQDRRLISDRWRTRRVRLRIRGRYID